MARKKKWLQVYFEKDNSLVTVNLDKYEASDNVKCDPDSGSKKILMKFDDKWWDGIIVAEAGKTTTEHLFYSSDPAKNGKNIRFFPHNCVISISKSVGSQSLIGIYFAFRRYMLILAAERSERESSMLGRSRACLPVS